MGGMRAATEHAEEMKKQTKPEVVGHLKPTQEKWEVAPAPAGTAVQAPVEERKP